MENIVEEFAWDVAIKDVLEEITTLRKEVIESTALSGVKLERVHANYIESARNLLHYLALRRRDLRPLQRRLAALGLSSLGRAEPHVKATIDSVLKVLTRLAGSSDQSPIETTKIVFATGNGPLNDHTEQLLGPPPAGRHARIMVTMPREAAEDYALVQDLLRQGMDCMRINCAHDNSAIWIRMIEHLKLAEKSTGKSCRVVMDLAGPKLRTGPLEPGAKVIRSRPGRDVYGKVIRPARIWLTSRTSPHPPPSPASACLPVPGKWVECLVKGEQIKFIDARGAKRSLEVVDVRAFGCWAELHKTAYMIPGMVLRRSHVEVHGGGRMAHVGELPSTDNNIRLSQGDLLILNLDLKPGRPATYDSAGEVLTPATIGCTLPEVFQAVKSGESIWFDDGKIGGIIEKVESSRIHIRINQARKQGENLRADKGINLPDSNLSMSAITAKDREDLAFAVEHADVVELSFANTASDVETLQECLSQLGGRQPAIVLKIETRQGFENLPEMLLTAMRMPCCGVMIARGDLAVECGFERLAEVQEEILWICEAAHVPVIWATQVLETLAKEGMASRAEITDAAMADRAECVMLNKGPHIVTAVRTLDNILHRMQAHHSKKQSMLRELRVAHRLSVESISAEKGERQ